MTISCSIASLIRMHKKCLKRHTMVYVELINQVRNSRIGCTLGYYWPTMIADAIKYAQRCKACQIHADFIHQPPELLHPTITSCPFEAWWIDIVGPINPSSTKGHRFILTITDYFSKWAETIPLIEVKTSMWSILSNTTSFIGLVFPGGLFMIMVPNLQAKYSIDSAINTESRMWHQPLITQLLMVWRKHSTR